MEQELVKEAEPVVMKQQQYTKAQTLSRVRELVKVGKTHQEVAEQLGVEGYRTPRGKIPTQPYVAGLLHASTTIKKKVEKRVARKVKTVRAERREIKEAFGEIKEAFGRPAITKLDEAFDLNFLRKILKDAEYTSERKVQLLTAIYL
jgi:chromatin segregation and condensation protein Rec8/ScpA/Scc1 (kleisin family)